MSAMELMRIERFIKLHYEVKVSLMYGNNNNAPTVSILSIIVPAEDRRQGLGTVVLSYLCREADALGWNLLLEASPRLGTTVEVLVDFYSRFGFQELGLNTLGEPIMFREQPYQLHYR